MTHLLHVECEVLRNSELNLAYMSSASSDANGGWHCKRNISNDSRLHVECGVWDIPNDSPPTCHYSGDSFLTYALISDLVFYCVSTVVLWGCLLRHQWMVCTLHRGRMGLTLWGRCGEASSFNGVIGACPYNLLLWGRRGVPLLKIRCSKKLNCKKKK